MKGLKNVRIFTLTAVDANSSKFIPGRNLEKLEQQSKKFSETQHVDDSKKSSDSRENAKTIEVDSHKHFTGSKRGSATKHKILNKNSTA